MKLRKCSNVSCVIYNIYFSYEDKVNFLKRKNQCAHLYDLLALFFYDTAKNPFRTEQTSHRRIFSVTGGQDS